MKIARYRRVSSKGRVSYQLVFDRTPFYGNSGVRSAISLYRNRQRTDPVVATEKENGLIIHIVTQLPENPEATFMPSWIRRNVRRLPTTIRRPI